MTILNGFSTPPPRQNMNGRAIFYIAFAASIFCLWTVFAWYQGLFEELQVARQERDAAINLAKAWEHEQKVQSEEMQKVKERYGAEIMGAHEIIAELNDTKQAAGYVNYPSEQLDGGDDIVVAIKTGATEIFKTLPVHFSTTLTHVPNFLLFSDHEQTIGDYHVQDSLNESSSEAINNFRDFQLYRDQQQFMAMGQNPEFVEFTGGWDLDKYKNVHIMVKAYKQQPNAKWYFFIDADSYILMGNLIPYLRNLDHTQKLYFGSPTWVGDINFAHGGTGYIISHAAVQTVVENNPDIGKQYESTAKDNCCGDAVLAKCLRDHDIHLIWAYPNFQGEPPYRMEFAKERMCAPLLTLHHMLPRDIGEFWEWERKTAQKGEYLLWADAFNFFVDPYLEETRKHWDNMGGDRGEIVDIDTAFPVQESYQSRPSAFDRCRQTCIDKVDCVQFRVRKEECKISTNLMLGWKVPVSNKEHEEYKSGWLMDRVAEMKKAMPCHQPAKDWPHDEINLAHQNRHPGP